MQVVVQSLEQTITKVHVTDWVDSFWEVHTSWHLTVSVGPFMLDSLHMPLVYNNNDSLVVAGVNLSEEVFISLVDKNSLEFREKDIHRLNIPVHKVGVKTFFGKLCRFRIVKSAYSFFSFSVPEDVACVLKSLVNVVGKVHSCFVIESSPCSLIELRAKELELGTLLFGFFACKFDLKAGFHECEVAWDLEVILESSQVKVETEPEHAGSGVALPKAEALIPRVLVEILIVGRKLLLRVNILEHFGSIPPLLVGLNKNSIRLDLLDQLLSSLGQHRGLISCTNKEDFFSIESLCKVDECALKAVLSKLHKTQLARCR